MESRKPRTFHSPYDKPRKRKAAPKKPKQLSREGIWTVELFDLKIKYNVWHGVVQFYPQTPQKWIDRHVWVHWSKVSKYWRSRGATLKHHPELPPF